jgi:hypothetical protein
MIVCNFVKNENFSFYLVFDASRFAHLNVEGVECAGDDLSFHGDHVGHEVLVRVRFTVVLFDDVVP